MVDSQFCVNFIQQKATMKSPLFALMFLTTLSTANAIVNLTSTGCADVSGFQTCQNSVTTSVAACLNETTTQTETVACGCSNYIGNYNCYASYCWNRVLKRLHEARGLD
jgi:hypothetical protein